MDSNIIYGIVEHMYLIHVALSGAPATLFYAHSDSFLHQIQFKTSIDQSTIGKCSQLKQKNSKRCYFFKFI